MIGESLTSQKEKEREKFSIAPVKVAIVWARKSWCPCSVPAIVIVSTVADNVFNPRVNFVCFWYAYILNLFC